MNKNGKNSYTMKKIRTIILLAGFFAVGILFPANTLKAEEPEYAGYLFAYFEGSGEKSKQEQYDGDYYRCKRKRYFSCHVCMCILLRNYKITYRVNH
jgi:hypothetical protein